MNRLFFIGLLALRVLIPQAAHAQRKPLTPEQRQMYENQIKELQGMLSEFHQGKRDDGEAHAILWKMLYRYAIIGSTTTADFQQYKGEYDDLLRKHPEYKSNPPMEFREQIDADDIAKKQAVEVTEQIKHFVPSDNTAESLYTVGRDVVAVYQFRVELYHMPDGVEIYSKSSSENVAFSLNGRPYSLSPYKVKRFGGNLTSNWSGPRNSRIIALSTNCVTPKTYFPTDSEEGHLVGLMPDRSSTWTATGVDYEEFHGVISVDGKLWAELPEHCHFPDKVIDPYPVWPDGVILFDVKQIDTTPVDNGDDEPSLNNKRIGTWVWTSTKGFKRYGVGQLPADICKFIPEGDDLYCK